MDLVSPGDLVSASKSLQMMGGEKFAKTVFKVLKLDQVNKIYSSNIHLPSLEFLEKTLQEIKISYRVPEEDLKNLPSSGSFITISNHAFGGIDGLILISQITKYRTDYKVLVNFLLTQIKPLQDFFIGVNPFETFKDVKSSFGGLKDAKTHLANGHPMGFFPAGEVSSYKLKRRAVSDREWQHSMLKFIKKARVPIVPVYFSGHNSIEFNVLGFIHPILRTAKLPSELFNKQGMEIRVRMGVPVSVEEQDEFKDISDYGRFLRMKTYALGLDGKPVKLLYRIAGNSQEPVPGPVPDSLILEEIEKIRAEHLLFKIKENIVFCVPTSKIPNIMKEIGRKREITYREIGEGTNKSQDIDRYDPYFEQLFIWDENEKQLVGGYRVGKGNDILTRHGIKGFYINSLSGSALHLPLY